MSGDFETSKTRLRIENRGDYIKESRPLHISYFINSSIFILIAVCLFVLFSLLGLDGMSSLIIFGGLGVFHLLIALIAHRKYH